MVGGTAPRVVRRRISSDDRSRSSATRRGREPPCTRASGSLRWWSVVAGRMIETRAARAVVGSRRTYDLIADDVDSDARDEEY